MSIAGVDEAGRGPLAGPVYAAAVMFREGIEIDGLADSKALNEKKREALAEIIKAKSIWCIAYASVEEIDRLNILQATFLAMQRAVAGLSAVPARILVDGNRLPTDLPAPAEAIIKGDSKVAQISAASILAKTARDQVLLELDKQYPEYLFAQHKGYPTKQHRALLQQYGPCPAHRRSYKPVQQLLFPESVTELKS